MLPAFLMGINIVLKNLLLYLKIKQNLLANNVNELSKFYFKKI